VIFVPSFAEEMNRSKRMYVLCARLLANSGVDTVCFDYAGTGDSHGEWGSFEFADWKTNLLDVYQYVRQGGIKDISLIALRFGALIVADTIFTSDVQINKCIFWDPIESGEVFIRQLIRIKIAAGMAEESRKISTKDILSDIDQHGFMEVGGYHVSSSLINAINNMKLSNTINAVITRTNLHWMTLSKTNKGSIIQSTPNCVPNNLAEHLAIHPINDTRFWMQQEVTIAPKLLRDTCQIFKHAV